MSFNGWKFPVFGTEQGETGASKVSILLSAHVGLTPGKYYIDIRWTWDIIRKNPRAYFFPFRMERHTIMNVITIWLLLYLYKNFPQLQKCEQKCFVLILLMFTTLVFIISFLHFLICIKKSGSSYVSHACNSIISSQCTKCKYRW